MPRPIREQALELVTLAFQDARLGFDIRLQAAIALLLEPGGIGPAGGMHARYVARLEAMTVVETTGVPTFRQAVAALNRALHTYEPEPEPEPGDVDDVIKIDLKSDSSEGELARKKRMGP